MTVVELLAELASRGVLVSIDGSELVLRGAVRTIPAELMVEARKRKGELLALLAHEPLGSVQEVSRRLLAPGGPGWVVIRSEVLAGELVVFVRDADVSLPEPAGGLVRYTWRELMELAQATPEALRSIHAIKRAGRVVGGWEVASFARTADPLEPVSTSVVAQKCAPSAENTASCALGRLV